MYKLSLAVVLLFAGISQLEAQDSISNPSYGKKFIVIAGTHVVLWSGAYVLLNEAWYADYPRRSFHFFNDNSEWSQMDKAGHVWTTYHVSRLSTEMWKWTGLPLKKSVLLGSLSGMAYQSIIEIQDGFSTEWGFSWGDMASNGVGAAAFAVQELTWKEQRIQVKLSYWEHDYPAELLPRKQQLFGKGLSERILKDYNSQTYWLSVNLKSFMTQSQLPRWLNVSLGYSSDLMVGGRENLWVDKNGTLQDYGNVQRIRRFYLAPDLDLTKIKTRSKLIRGLFFALGSVKFPAPALELNSKGKIRFHGIYF
ncbi:MAG: DUF2279 domain-containing protein [Chitinophagaceae bacterium]|nr:DUF2279 domain-containing protein [Chitinophagaceae bacterium]